MTEPELDQQAQMTYDVLIQMLRRLDHERRILLVHPDQVELTEAAVAALPVEYLPGLIEVRASRFLNPDELVCFRPPTWMLPPPAAFAPGHPLPHDLWRCPVCRRFEGHKLDCSIGRRSS